jgi:ectoine hydroxylase
MRARPSEDRFPTRTASSAEPVTRTDPVVYSSGAGPLDAERLAAYATSGYLSIDGLLDGELVGELLAEVERLATDGSVRGSELAVLEPDHDVVRSVFDVHRISPLMADLVADPRLVGPAQQILGSDVYIHQSRVNRKPAFHGRDFYWHSDFETWHAEDGMPAMRAVSLSIALTPNDATNGSLMVIPRSHRTFVPTVGDTPTDHFQRSLRRQEVGVPDEAGLLALAEQGGGVDLLTGGPGSAVLFDSNLMHGSTGNMTPYGRTNLFVVYNSVHNALEAPFAAPSPRPQFVANRQPVAVGKDGAKPHSSSITSLT